MERMKKTQKNNGMEEYQKYKGKNEGRIVSIMYLNGRIAEIKKIINK